MLHQEFAGAIVFSNNLVDEIKNNFRQLLTFLAEFKNVYDDEERKLPYHINLIDELRANENAHSRILEKLLKQQEPTNQKYELLNSFLQFITSKYAKKLDFSEIKIESPEITQEIKRIDLWIRDKKNYAIVIENKINNAPDQSDGKRLKGGQLERYIDVTKEHNFKEEQIYVLYLPPTYEREPDQKNWGRYYNSDIRAKRYLKLSFKDDILQWLKNILPNISNKDKYLSSAIEQYVDHLEGKFSLRTINNKMNMELQEFIRKELGLNDLEPEEALKQVVAKEKEMQNALNQLEELQEKIKIEHFLKWEDLLKADFPQYEIIGNWTNPDVEEVNIGLKINFGENLFSLLIEYNYTYIYYGIGIHGATLKKNRKLNFKEIISQLGLSSDKNEEWWYCWDDTTFPDAYMRLKNLIEKIELQYIPDLQANLSTLKS